MVEKSEKYYETTWSYKLKGIFAWHGLIKSYKHKTKQQQKNQGLNFEKIYNSVKLKFNYKVTSLPKCKS